MLIYVYWDAQTQQATARDCSHLVKDFKKETLQHPTLMTCRKVPPMMYSIKMYKLVDVSYLPPWKKVDPRDGSKVWWKFGKHGHVFMISKMKGWSFDASRCISMHVTKSLQLQISQKVVVMINFQQVCNLPGDKALSISARSSHSPP